MPQWRRNIYILLFAQFLVMSSMSLVMPFLPLYIQEMGVAQDKVAFWAGWIFGINFLSSFIVSPIWGNLADRYGRKVMVLRSGFGMAIITGLMGAASNVWQLLILRLFNGMISGFIPASIALVAATTPRSQIGYAMGLLQAGGVAGSILGPFIGGVLATWIGFREIFYITGLLLFMAALLVLFLVKEENKPNPKDHPRGQFIQNYKRVLQTPYILPLFFIGFMIQFATLLSLPLISLYVQELMPTSDKIELFAGITAAVMGFSNMLFAPILGRWGDRYGSQKILFYSVLGAAVAFIPHAFVVNIWQLLILRFLLGMCVGGLLPSLNSLVKKHANKDLESLTYGFSNSSVALGNFLGPIIGGYLVGLISLSGLFIMASILLFITWLWMKWMFAREDTHETLNNL